MDNFKESNEQFLETMKKGLKVCEMGSSIDINYTGIACEVKMNIKIDQKVSEITKKLLLTAITLWGQSVAFHYEDPKKVNIHIKLTYNDDGTFTIINTLDADDILNSIKDEDE